MLAQHKAGVVDIDIDFIINLSCTEEQKVSYRRCREKLPVYILFLR